MPIREENQEAINEHWNSIQSKMDELQVLRKKLNCSLAIQSLWSEAFELGAVKSYFRGNMYKIREMRFVIEAGITEREFTLFEIPEILLNRQIELQIEKSDSVANKETWEKVKKDICSYKKFLTSRK